MIDFVGMTCNGVLILKLVTYSTQMQSKRGGLTIIVVIPKVRRNCKMGGSI